MILKNLPRSNSPPNLKLCKKKNNLWKEGLWGWKEKHLPRMKISNSELFEVKQYHRFILQFEITNRQSNFCFFSNFYNILKRINIQAKLLWEMTTNSPAASRYHRTNRGFRSIVCLHLLGIT